MRPFSRLVLLLALCVPAYGGTGCTVISTVVGKEKRDVYKFDPPFTV